MKEGLATGWRPGYGPAVRAACKGLSKAEKTAIAVSLLDNRQLWNQAWNQAWHQQAKAGRNCAYTGSCTDAPRIKGAAPSRVIPSPGS